MFRFGSAVFNKQLCLYPSHVSSHMVARGSSLLLLACDGSLLLRSAHDNSSSQRPPDSISSLVAALNPSDGTTTASSGSAVLDTTFSSLESLAATSRSSAKSCPASGRRATIPGSQFISSSRLVRCGRALAFSVVTTPPHRYHRGRLSGATELLVKHNFFE